MPTSGNVTQSHSITSVSAYASHEVTGDTPATASIAVATRRFKRRTHKLSNAGKKVLDGMSLCC